jgi:K+-sensing histidine kinase KdpD
MDADHALTFSELAQLVHDFKGPLSLVALETQVLQTQLDDGAHVEMVHAITRVLLNIDHIDRMVHDLIDSCAIDASHLELHRKSIDLCELLEQVTSRMAASRDRGRIVLDAPSRVVVHADALRIERVFAHLVHNALVHSPDETSVMVKLDTSQVFARISVRDAGPGMTRAQVEQVFDEHPRCPSYLHESTRLGLFVGKQIVEAHGGHIGVQSTPGIGSRFYFELPLP